MVAVLLLMLFLALVSLALWLYSRTVLGAAAAQAARYVANADVPAEQAAAKVAEILGTGVAGSTSSGLRCAVDGDTAGMVGVSCTMPAPGIVSLLDGVLPDVSAAGHAAEEGR